YEIAIDPEKLRSMNLSVAEVFDAIHKNNANTGGSYIEKGSNALYIRGEGMAKSLEELEKVVIKNTNNIPITIRDVAKVQFGHAVRYGAMTGNGTGEVAGGVVMLLKGANSYATVTMVKEKMAEIQKSLPEGIQIEAFIDRTKLIDKAIHTVTSNLVEGGLIVIFVLVLLLGNLRAGLIVASVIPLSMLFALSLMNVFGVSANLMSLGAIDFGLIVDGAVIIVEAILHFIHLKYSDTKLSQDQMDDEVYHASTRIRQSAAFGEIIILMVYVPILALSGVEGKMFKPMAETVIFAILGALILSLTYVPMASAFFLSKKVVHKKTFSDKIIDRIQRVYHPILQWTLKQRWLVLGVTLGLFGASLWLFSTLGGEFIPELEEGDFAIEARIAPGSSLTQMVKSCTQAEKELLKFPEVKKVVCRIGSSEIPVDPMPIESADIIVVLKDKKEWTTADNQEELVEKMNEKLAEIPGLVVDFQQPIQMRFNELISGVKSDVAIKIFGENLSTLFSKANEVAATISKVEGVTDVKVEQTEGMPQILTKFKREKIAQYGVNITDLNTAIRTAFAGEKAGVIFEGEKRFDLVVRFDERYRVDIENIRHLYVELPNGNKVPMEEVASIEMQNAPMQVSREFAKRRIFISFNVRGRDVETTVKEVVSLLDKQVKLPDGYFYKYGGQFQNLIEAKERLTIAVPIALGVIFILLFFTFNSLKQSIMIFSAIPLSAIGGVVALWIRDMPFSISAGIGFIALFGVAVLNGIVLIGYFNQLEKDGVKDLLERIFQGTEARLRPVLMTAAVASMGFLPMALSTAAGAEVQRPLATVVIGGLISATLLTLFVLPVIYSLFSTREKLVIPKPIALGVWIILGMVLCQLLFSSGQATAQTNPTSEAFNLQKITDYALTNSQLMGLSNQEIDQQKALRKSSTDLGKTSVMLQYGRTQDPNMNDYTGSITQRIPFPTTFSAQKGVYTSLVGQAEKTLEARKNQLLRDLKSAYYELYFTTQLQKLVERQDSLFSNFSKAAGLRYSTGETNKLEQVTSLSRSQEIKNRLFLLSEDIQIVKTNLKRLMNKSDELMISFTEPFRKESPVVNAVEKLTVDNNPNISVLKQTIELRKKQVGLEKTFALPDFTVGYFNQSILRVANLSFVEAGLSVPLFYRPFNARIQAAVLAEKVANSTLAYQMTLVQGELDIQVQQLNKLKKSLTYYDSFALPQAEELLRNAKISYANGEIGYVEFVTANAQAYSVLENYLLTVHQHNLVMITIESLTGN
ncbi:MAG: CusA/CzcA family heavy metal efflux RND transporter, partial [Cytophagales bacterium]|nr:CusA/CzcA family heavy metal efflux RND transporter [Cytophagales bacterium]